MTRSPVALVALVASSVLGLAACSATPDDGGGLVSSTRRNPIVNGAPTSDYPATGMLLMQGQPSCTGTVVGPRTVLTAAHCVDGVSPTSLEFGFGPSAGQIQASVQVIGTAQHPKWDSQQLLNDIAVLTLAEDAPVQRASMNSFMDAGWVGKQVTLVGYGVTDGPSQSGAGTKRMVDVTIDQVDATTLHYTTEQGKTACNGDSGGPAYVEVDGNLVIVGVTSYGDQNCQQFGVYTRVDTYLDFVFEQIAAAGPGNPDPNQPDPNNPDPNNPDPNDPNNPGDPNDPNYPGDPGGDPGCNGETWEGRCEGDTVIWCEDGQVMSIDCMACGYNDQCGYYDCVQ